MKYILGKELPFARAGRKVYVEKNGLYVFSNEARKVWIGNNTESSINDYIKNGWIKKIKYTLER